MQARYKHFMDYDSGYEVILGDWFDHYITMRNSFLKEYQLLTRAAGEIGPAQR